MLALLDQYRWWLFLVLWVGTIPIFWIRHVLTYARVFVPLAYAWRSIRMTLKAAVICIAISACLFWLNMWLGVVAIAYFVFTNSLMNASVVMFEQHRHRQELAATIERITVRDQFNREFVGPPEPRPNLFGQTKRVHWLKLTEDGKPWEKAKPL